MISLEVKHGGDLHKKILDAVRDRVRNGSKRHTDRVAEWRKAEELFTAYLPKSDADRLRDASNESGEATYAKIKLPYSYAVAMAAHSYWTSVFLSRTPVFQYQGTNDAGEQSVQAIEALHQYQVTRGRQLPPLYIWFQDVGKYGEGWLLNYWDEETHRYSTIEEVEDKFLGIVDTGRMKKVRRVVEKLGFQGNKVANIHPAKVVTDPRYPRNRFQDGEFVAIDTTLSSLELKVGEDKGRYINITKLTAPTPHEGYTGEITYEESNDPLNTRPDVDDFGSSYDPKASDVYEVYEVYINLIPKLWKLGSGTLPEKWVFTVDKKFSTVLECRPMGNMHNRFPMAYIELEPEGYANFSRSLLEIFSPVQTTLDWLVNSHFFNVRQVMNNNFVFDPSRVYDRDFQTREPGLAIRLKPAAYGTDPRAAIHQLQVSDVTKSHMGDMAMMYDLGERLGISDSVMGMTAPSSRRTAQEIRGDQAFGMSRLKTTSEYFSATGVSDLGRMQLMNSQQFYSMDIKLRIVGAAAQTASETFIHVTPEMILGEFDLEPVDGTLPIDRFAMVNLWQNLIGQMAQVPQVLARYDLGKIFGYVAQLGGIRNLNRFQVEMVPDQQLMDQAASGMVEPAKGDVNLLEPGQVPGVGPTA